MQYQKRRKTFEKQNEEKINDKNNQKKIITTTTIEKISQEKKSPKITTTKVYNSGKAIKDNIRKIEEKEITQEENVTMVKKSIVQTEEYKRITPASLMNKPSSFQVYLSSRYHHHDTRPIEGSPKSNDQFSGTEEKEYNIHTLNARKSPDNLSIKRNYLETEKKYTQYSANPLFDNQPNINTEPDNNMRMNANDNLKITFNTKSYRPPMIPQNKMSPILNYDDGNSSYDNKKYSEQRYRYGNNFSVNPNNNSNIENVNLNMSNYNNNRVLRSTFGQVSRDRILTEVNSPSYKNDRNNSQNSNTVSYKELKRIVKKFNKVYDPYRNEKGLLLKQSQVTLPGAADEIFNNRYRVLSKMNRLSNILLAKQKKIDEDTFSSRDNSRDKYNADRRNSRNSKNSKNSPLPQTKTIKKSKRLLLVSLRMMSGTEDKMILRKMRNEKGGVVDLAQEKINKNKFKIKKASKMSRGGGRTILKSNPKYREKAAKIIQAWWKELKDIYNYKLQQIIKIQSIWKGRWVRKNIYDLLYLNYLYLSFCEKIQKVLKDEMLRYAFEKLKNLQKYSQENSQEKLKVVVLKMDKRRLSLIRKMWERWIKLIQNDKMKEDKGKNLLQIRADKENKLGKLRTAFTIWKYNTKMENIKNRNIINENEEIIEEGNEDSLGHKKVIKITKITEKERYLIPGKEGVIEKDKFKGLMKIIEGANNYYKKFAYDETKPKIKDYLKDLAIDELLRKIFNKRVKKEQYILKKILYKWLTKTTLILSSLEKDRERDYEDDREKIDKNDYTNLKAKIFIRRIENVKNKQKKMILRKYFYRYLKNSLLLGKEEERQKVLDQLNKRTDKNENDYNYNDYDYIPEENSEKNKDTISLSIYHKIHNKKNKRGSSSSASIKRIGLNNISNNLEGSKILERYIWRHTHKYILECFKNKMDEEILIVYLLRIIKMREKYEKDLLKKYLDQWKNNTFKRKNNDLISKMFLKILKIIIENNKKKLLNKKLYQWLKIVHILNGKDTTFLKSKNTIDLLDNIKKFINRKFGGDFFDKLKQLRKQNFSNQILRKIINKQDNKNRRKLLGNGLNTWRNKLSDFKIEALKGKLLIKLYERYKDNKKRDILKNKLDKWKNNTILIYKITQIVNKENEDLLYKQNNQEKIIIILRAIIRNLNRKKNDKVLQKFFTRWKRNVQDRNKNIEDASKYILKVNKLIEAKYFFNKLKEKDKKESLKKIIIKYGKSKDDILDYYFKKWMYINKNIELTDNSNIIQDFCRKRLKNKINIKRWKRLYSLLKNKDNRNNIKNILKNLKCYKGISKLNKTLNKTFKKYLFNIFRNRKNIKKISYTLIETIEIIDRNKYNKLLRKYLLRWRNNAIRRNNKDETLKNMMKVLETKRIKNTTKNINDIFLLVKLLRDIPKMRGLYFLRKLRLQGKHNNLYKNLSYDIIKTSDDLLNKNREPIIKRILKIYTYKVLSNLFNDLERRQKNRIKPNIKDFFNKLFNITVKTNEFNYRKKDIIDKKPKIVKGMKVHFKTTPKLKRDEKDNKTTVYQQLTPFLTKYLDDIFKNQKKNILDIIGSTKSKNITYNFIDFIKKNLYRKFGPDFMNKLDIIKKQSSSTQILKKIINRLNNKNRRSILRDTLNKWKNQVSNYKIETLKGKLLLKIYDRFKANKIKDLLKNKLNKWENNTVLIYKITKRVDKETKDLYNLQNNKDKIIIILKSIIRNTNRKNNDKLLYKYFNRWKKNGLGRNKNIENAGKFMLKIEKKLNAKYFFDKLKEKDKKEILKKIIIKYGRSKDDILDYYFKKWIYINKLIAQTDYANIIQEFCKKRLKNKINIKRWRRLYSLLKNKDRNRNIKDILNKIKHYFGTIKLYKTLNRNKIDNKRNIFDTLRNTKSKKVIKVTLIEIFETVNKNINDNLLRKYLLRWRNNAIIKNNKEEALKNMMKTLETKRIKNSTKNITNIFILVKLLRDIPKIRGLYFLRKLRQQGKHNNLYKNLSNDIIKTNGDLLNKNRKPIIKRILKIYTYKVLSNLFNDLEKRQKNRIKPNIKEFFNKLFKITVKTNEFNFRKQNIIDKKPKIVKGMNFHFKTTPKLKRDEKDNKTTVYQQLTPFLTKYLDDIFKNQKKNILDIIGSTKSKNITYNFIDLIKKNLYKKFGPDFMNKLDIIKKQSSSTQILKKIINRLNNKNRRSILRDTLNKWKNQVSNYKIETLKGKLLLKIYDRYKDNKIKDILKNKLRQWENNTVLIYKITTKVNKETTEIYNVKNNQDKINIILRNFIRNINRRNNDILLHKYFNRWKKNVQDTNKNIEDGSKYIIKIDKKINAKYLFDRLKENKKNKILTKLINKYGRPTEDILNYYLQKWAYINKLLKQINNSNIIQEFCRSRLRKKITDKKWIKLYELLKNKNRKNNIRDILYKIKYYKGINNLFKTLDKNKENNNKNIFDKLRNTKNRKKINITLIETIEIIDRNKYNKLLRKYLLRWRNNAIRRNNKDETLKNMMKVLETKRIKNAAKNMNDIFLLVKLLRDIPKIRGLYFLRKLRQQGKHNNLYKNLSNDIIKTNDDLLNQNRKSTIKRILKIYTYKVLSNLFNDLERRQKNKIKPNIKDFFKKLYAINMKANQYKYIKESRLHKKPNVLRGMKLHLRTTSSKNKLDEKNNKSTVYQHLTPYLVKYLNRIFRNVKYDVFDEIKNNTDHNKFCKLYKKFKNKSIIPDKEDLVDSLKYYVYMKLTKINSSNNLYYLIRRAIIRKILNISKNTGSLSRILNLIKITMTHKKIAKDRWLLRLIKRWRFITFVKKMAMKKMELMYKDLHVTYLEMADSVLNEGSPLGPYGSRIMNEMNSDKYLFDFNDPYLVKGSKAYKGMKKQYVFEPMDAEIEERIKMIKEIEEIDKMKEINKTYYDYGYGEGEGEGDSKDKFNKSKVINYEKQERKSYNNKEEIDLDKNKEFKEFNFKKGDTGFGTKSGYGGVKITKEKKEKNRKSNIYEKEKKDIKDNNKYKGNQEVKYYSTIKKYKMMEEGEDKDI